MTARQTDWPTFRQNGKRNGASSSTLPDAMQTRWKTNLDGRLSGVTVAAGKVFLAKIDAHTVCALNEQAGDVIWEYTVGGRVDSPPTFYKGSVIFGCADGRVYCLRASDGELVWQFLAAPADRRMMAYEQIESVWPVHGSVLVRDDEVCFVAGRSMFLDKGMRFYRLDAKTGQQLSVTVMDEQNPHTGENLQSDAKYLTMPVALSDILSSDDEYIYMRSQRFDLDGKRQKIRTLPDELFGDFDDQNVTDNQYMHQDKYMKFLENVQQNTRGNHLFCPSGFLDDSWYHRTYWVYGKHYMGGWNGYFLSGKFLPTGRILTHDDDTVFGFGRKNEYYRWTTQMEYHLFATPKVHDIGTKPITEGRRKGHLTLDNEKSFEWSLEVPLLVRAMALSADKIVVAGPPDVLDEEVAINQLTSADTQASIEKQQDAMNGKLGGVLQVISKSDGNLVAEYNLDSPPVWDGMAVANNQVYVPTLDGHVICMGE
jgi:outer membrane protein assembly factor BamB